VDYPVIKFAGLNNRLRAGELRNGKVWRAVNCQFRNDGSVVLPNQSTTLVKSGDCHSVFKSHVGVLYVENDNLYKLADTPVELLTGIGSDPVNYELIGNTVYFSNGTVTGRYVKGESSTREWGVPVPDNPTITAITTGGMYAGDYRVVITWIADNESGAGNSETVTVAEGGGISLTSFPAAPSYVTKFAVWVSGVNGETLFLYNEYSIATTSVNIVRHDSSIALTTQFGQPPVPTSRICLHYGNLYYADGAYLRFTHLGETGPNYGLEMPFNFFPFDSTDVQVVVSVPNVLYVGTQEALYRIFNLNGEEPPILERLQDCAAVKGSECCDTDGNAYFMTSRGFIKATPEGLQELSFADVAIPSYLSGYSTITDIDGIKSLLFFGVDGTANPLVNSDWPDGVPDAWCINLETGAVSYYETFNFNTIHSGYVANSSGISTFSTVRNGDGLVQTGKLNFDIPSQKRISDAIINVDGACTLTVATDNATVAYTVRTTTIQEHVKHDLAKGAKGAYWQFSLANKTGSFAVIGDVGLVVQPIRRH